jgi:outer membrane protein TolC
VRAAEGTFRLTRQRKEFGIGAALEDIIAEQDLTRARLDYVAIVAEFNKAQLSLLRTTGRLQDGNLHGRAANK